MTLSAARKQADLAGVTIAPLSPRIGAVIDGLDIAGFIDDETVKFIQGALWKHKVLVFHGNQFSPEGQRNFAARFGRLHINPISPSHPSVPEIMVLSVDQDNRPERAVWHTDVTFHQTPPLGAILHCVECPPVGGDTIWSSCAAALDTLSKPIQDLLDGLTAEHDFRKLFRPQDYTGPEARERWEAAVRSHPPVIHPVIRRHPDTGEKSLFINEGFTTRILELEEAESAMLLNFLFAHMVRPEVTYRHRWAKDDVIFWDNRITAHYPVSDYWPMSRRVHRATILGDELR
jgi:taurine dioxygenase